MEAKFEELNQKYENALSLIQELQDKVKQDRRSRSKSKRRSRHSSSRHSSSRRSSSQRSQRSKSPRQTDNETTDDQTTDASDSETSTRRKTRTRHKKQNITQILKQQNKIIKSLANRTIPEDDDNSELRQLINGLSDKGLQNAFKNTQTTNLPDAPNTPKPPKLKQNRSVKSETLRNTIASLKDLFRNQFSGKESEDIDGLLRETTKLAEDGKLSIKNYYTLLKSRIQMGSPLYSEVTEHEKNNSSLKTLFNEMIPIYTNSSSYLKNLNKLNNYKPSPNTPANQILSQVKMLVSNLAGSSNATDKHEFILTHTRDKILSLFPTIAPNIIERELASNSKTMTSFTKIFLNLAPVAEIKRTNKILETKESDTENEEDNTPTTRKDDTIHIIRMTQALADRFKNLCYKCGGTSDQAHHFGRDCTLYQNKALAYYLCSTCKLGIHLPKDCQYKKKEEVNVIFEVIPDDNESNTKNA